jgi:hypothetical protein
MSDTKRQKKEKSYIGRWSLGYSKTQRGVALSIGEECPQNILDDIENRIRSYYRDGEAYHCKCKRCRFNGIGAAGRRILATQPSAFRYKVQNEKFDEV